MKTEILNNLPADFAWRENIMWFDSVDSTNTRAKTLAILGMPHGTVLVAGHQSAGRGRMGRSFLSPKDMGIYMSVILRPECKQEDLMHLTCAAAVAMCDAVENAVGIRPGIKWTNDLVCGKRKIAGILTEVVTIPEQTAVILGIGINCCQQIQDFDPAIQSFAGSLAMAAEKEIDRAKVAAEMILALKKMDESLLKNKHEMLVQYRDDCITIDKDISIIRGDDLHYGHAFGIDDNGALLVGFPDGHTEAVNSGEVSIRGMYGYI